jgi:hypothetical protein
MKKSMLLIILLLLSFSMFSCRSETLSQSSFKEEFTFGEIVENNAQYLIPGSRQLFSSEYGESEQPFTQKQEEMILQIEAADIPDFFTAVRSDVEEAIVGSGANIVGGGSGGVIEASFSIQYQQDQSYGTIFVWGVRGEGTNYTIIVLISES